MIILDGPYVSDLLLDTIKNENLPVIENNYFSQLPNTKNIVPFAFEQAVIELNTKEHPVLYTNSENAIFWVSKYLKNTKLPDTIDLFKDKARFRRLVQDMYPKFFFKEVAIEHLDALDLSQIQFPFIIKPSVGFFSLGVHKVDSINEWPSVVDKIHREVAQNEKQYPKQVVNQSSFIIEQLIEGDEYAFDAYFNDKGEPVVLGIYKHLFSSDADVSDRVYYTSKELIDERLSAFENFLNEVGRRAPLKNFPLHVEVRIDKGELIPIEVNPMRFGGWCTTADLTTHAYGFNPYVYFHRQLKPDWNELLKDKAGKNYCLVILDNSTGMPQNQIAAFNYDAVVLKFEKVLELRKTDWKNYPVFGIMFTETRQESFHEIEQILKSDLKEFVHLKELV